MHRQRAILACLTVALVLGAHGCRPAAGAGAASVARFGSESTQPLRMTYLGTGGWIMEHQGEQILAAPLFSNPGFVTTGLGKISSDTVEVDRFMGRYDVSGARAILVGHAHYDHLMDVPRVALAHAPEARVLGSLTVANVLGSWSGVGDRVDTLEGFAGDEEAVGRWIPLGPRIRVMPLRSLHGPHFDGRTLYRGTVDRPRAQAPRWATEWVEGHTFAFLVDFLDAAGGVAFRVYYQDAVAPPTLGLAPTALIEERPVDVAVLVPATFEEVAWHPEAIAANLRPGRILLGHWEDFFQPMGGEGRTVPLSDLTEFERRLDRVFGGEVIRPEPFTQITIPASGEPSRVRAWGS